MRRRGNRCPNVWDPSGYYLCFGGSNCSRRSLDQKVGYPGRRMKTLRIWCYKSGWDYPIAKRIVDEMSDSGISIGEKAVRGIIERADLVKHQKHPKKKPTRPFYAPYPGYRVQIDTKAAPVRPGEDKRRSRRQQFTAIDIVSKIRYLAVKDGLSNSNSIAFVREALAFYESIGITVECVQTDNHSTFTNLSTGGNKKRDHELERIHPFTQYLSTGASSTTIPTGYTPT